MCLAIFYIKKTSFLDYKKSIFEWLQNWNFSKEIAQFWSKIGLTEPFSFRTEYLMEMYSVMFHMINKLF